MKMAELSASSGMPVPTIKLYLREGLLPPGESTDANQAQYSDAHLRRLGVIRGLVKLGGLSLATAKTVLEAIDSDLPLGHVFGIAQAAATRPVDDSAVSAKDLGRVDAVMGKWHCETGSPGRRGAAAALHAMADAGLPEDARWMERYAQAALIVAEADLDFIDAAEGRDAKAEAVVVGTILGDAFFAGLRRAAQEHLSSIRYAAPDQEQNK